MQRFDRTEAEFAIDVGRRSALIRVEGWRDALPVDVHETLGVGVAKPRLAAQRQLEGARGIVEPGIDAAIGRFVIEHLEDRVVERFGVDEPAHVELAPVEREPRAVLEADRIDIARLIACKIACLGRSQRRGESERTRQLLVDRIHAGVEAVLDSVGDL